MAKTALSIAIAALCLAGCALTPTQERALIIGASVLVVGAAAAHQADRGDPPHPNVQTPSVNCTTASCY